jgi:hypothetical protein
MEPTADVPSILRRLEPYWDRIVRRPLSNEEIQAIEQEVGRPAPQCLRQFLGTLGLFQDAIPEFFAQEQDLVEAARFLPELLGPQAEDFFPFADDGAGDYNALRIGDPEDQVYFIDHERRSAEPIGKTFQQWLAEMVEAALAGMSERRHVSEMKWAVQFSFRTSSIEPILAVLAEMGELSAPRAGAAGQAEERTLRPPAKPVGLLGRLLGRKPEPASRPPSDGFEWKCRGESPAGVHSWSLSIVWRGWPLEISRLDFPAWPVPMVSFDFHEPVSLAKHGSMIRRLDALFRASGLDYELCDYGPIGDEGAG